MRVRKPPSNGAGRKVAKPLAGWTEADSDAFGALARIAVPARNEQIAILTELIPARRDEVFTAVELGAGQGALARVVLRTFPRCRYVALDRSERMRAALGRALRAHGSRAVVRGFDLDAAAWRRDLPQPLRCVLASLHQLQWLEDAGFGQVDCFWMHAGHAIFGAYVLRGRGVGRRPATRARRRV